MRKIPPANSLARWKLLAGISVILLALQQVELGIPLHLETSPTPSTPPSTCLTQARCAFIVSSGRSGSTAVQDTLNQLDGYFIRGENGGAFQALHDLYTAYTYLSSRVNYSSADEEKIEYDKFIRFSVKPAWYNYQSASQPLCAARSFFKSLYGYGHFSDWTVGFKEVRFDIRTLQLSYYPTLEKRFHRRETAPTTYATFASHVNFLRSLCHTTKVIFNARRDVNATANSDFYAKLPRNETVPALELLEEWMRKYSKTNDAFTVYYEEMFDATKNATLAAGLLKYLGHDPRTPISFTRTERL